MTGRDHSRNERAAAAERRPTEDPLRFLLPTEQLPPGFAERVDSPPDPPADARPAATVVLLRAADGGAEALLLRRPRRSSFAADAWVFPGGRVDTADAAPALAERMHGPDADEWSRRLGLADATEALAFVAAALREAWEETGIMLAREAYGCPPETRARLESLRGRVLAGDLDLSAVIHELDLHPSTDDLLYLAHWITPVVEPRRYDTRFFAARVPAESACSLQGDELAEAVWIKPAAAVQRFRDGNMRMLPPTVHTLERLAPYGSLDDLWNELRHAPVPTHLPRMQRVEGGVVIEVVETAG